MEPSSIAEYGYTALHTAVISRDLDAVISLTKGQCDLESRDAMGFTALQLAALRENKKEVEVLVSAGCDVNSKTKEGMTSLHVAAAHKRGENILYALLSSSCDVNAPNKLGRTALHLAAKRGNHGFLKALLDAGCDRNIKDKLGYTAVGLAFKFNQKKSADILLHYQPRRGKISPVHCVFDEQLNDEGGMESISFCDCLKSADEIPDKSLCVEPHDEISPSKLECTRVGIHAQNSKNNHHLHLQGCDSTIILLRRLHLKHLIPKVRHLLETFKRLKRNRLDGLTTGQPILEEEVYCFVLVLLPFINPSFNHLYNSSSPASDSHKTHSRISHLKVAPERKACVFGISLSSSFLGDLKHPLAISTSNASSSRPSGNRSHLQVSHLIQDVGFNKKEAFGKMFSKTCKEMRHNQNELLKTILHSISSYFLSNNTFDSGASTRSLWTNSKKTSISFPEAMLLILLQEPRILYFCFNQKTSLWSIALARIFENENPWTADKIARLFLQTCTALVGDQRLLHHYAGDVLRKALLHQQCNFMSLGTFILIRMGLLKGEVRVDVVESVEAPLAVLKFAFTQEYFPRELAAMFTSFLCKSSPRLLGLESLRAQALSTAITKEVQPASIKEAESVAGKSFKRICDIVALEKNLEIFLKCVDALFSRIILTLECNPWTIGESLLVYMGLLKSEYQIEIVRDLRTALILLNHAAGQSYFPGTLKQMFALFLERWSAGFNHSCCAEINQVLYTLRKI